MLNLQVLQGLSLWLSSLRQSDIVIPVINFALSDISSQLDPAKYQRMLFGIILILMMIYRQQGLIPAKRRAARDCIRRNSIIRTWKTSLRQLQGSEQARLTACTAEKEARPWRCSDNKAHCWNQ